MTSVGFEHCIAFSAWPAACTAKPFQQMFSPSTLPVDSVNLSDICSALLVDFLVNLWILSEAVVG